ncbi:MAG: hypothetical protein HY898_28585 [Deltaproteobacteria bacterium]|nr:hypothetical protein [Deltaproteobacteria bacterium]
MHATRATLLTIATWTGAIVLGCTKLLGVDGDYADQQPVSDASTDSSGGAAGTQGSSGSAGTSAGGASSGGAAGSAGAAATAGSAGAAAGGTAGSGGVSEPVAMVNGDFESNQEKTWFWDWNGQKGTGALVPGAIPGWSTDEDPGIGGPSGKGDSGVEPGGNPGMRLFLNSVDWEVYQTTSHAIQAGDAFHLAWDLRNTYAAQSGGNLDLIATLYFVDGSTRVAIKSETFTEPQSSTFAAHTLDASTVPPEAVGKLIGVSFDNATTGGQSWLAIDNVKLMVTH